MCATNAFLRSLGVEIYASGQRRWPDEVKAQVVAPKFNKIVSAGCAPPAFQLDGLKFQGSRSSMRFCG